MDRKAQIKIGRDGANRCVLDFLIQRFSYQDLEGWNRDILRGRVLVNGSAAIPHYRLQEGDILSYQADHLPEPPVETRYRLEYADPHILVVNKPGNLPCHPGGPYFRHTLWHMLKADTGQAQVSFIHRLDRGTSGLVVMARHGDAARNLNHQMRLKTIHREYVALVSGAFPETARAAGIIRKDAQSAVRKKKEFVETGEAMVAGPGQQSAITHFSRIWSDGEVSLVRAIPVTGRNHQIRATLLAIGHPLLGDTLYGPDETCFLRFIAGRLTTSDEKALKMPRQALHAASVCFEHPATFERRRFIADLPDDFQFFLAQRCVEIDIQRIFD